MWMLAACAGGGTDTRATQDEVVVLTADVTAGDWPLTVTFDGSASTAEGSFAWDFGDGAVGGGERAQHTYVGAGTFTVALTVGTSAATVEVDVGRPPCPSVGPAESWGIVTDPDLTEISGLAPSLRDPAVLWIVEDARNPEELVTLSTSGQVLGHFPLDDDNFSDAEDMASGRDPVTGAGLLYVADFGNNDFDKNEFAIWTFAEPPSASPGQTIPGRRMILKYPGEAMNSETLLVDPLTEDFYIVTKAADGRALVFLKAAPHRGSGPFVLEQVAELDFTDPPLSGGATTGGAVSPSGDRVVIRTYDDRAWMWRIDGYLPLAESFDGPPCEIQLADESQGETISFTTDGSGLLTVGELARSPVWYVPFRE